MQKKVGIFHMNKPLVSYLVVNYGKGRWVLDCLWSIFSQSYRPIEVVVCDNGSKDQSVEIIKRFEGVPWFHTMYYPEPLGIGKAFNLALFEAKGEYIAMLGSDDVAKPDHLELVMNIALANPDADILYGDIEEINAFGEFKKRVNVAKGLDHIYNYCSVGHSTGVTKKKTFDEIGGYDETLEMSVDYEFILRALELKKKFLYTRECGYQWRRFPGSDQVTIKNGGKSEVRVKCHSFIRKKYNLKGLCQCGCGAEGIK